MIVLCKCGCGNQTKICNHTNNNLKIKKGDYNKYILGSGGNIRTLRGYYLN